MEHIQLRRHLLQQTILESNAFLFWGTFILVHLAIIAMVFGMIVNMGWWWLLLLEAIFLFYSFFLARRMLVKIQLAEMNTQAVQTIAEHPVIITEPAEEVPGFPVDIPVYTPPVEQESILNSYESGYAPH